MKFVDKVIEVRRNLKRLLIGLLRPSILRVEEAREALNVTLKDHWKQQSLDVWELIWENWEYDANKAPKTNQAIVFIDREFDIDWISEKELDTESAKAVSYAETVGARRCKHLPLNQILEFRRLIGQSIASAIRGEKKSAATYANNAAQFLRDRTIERSRAWTLTAAHSVLAILIIFLVLLLKVSGDQSIGFPSEMHFFLVAIQGGLLGAYLSVVQRAGRGKWDASSGPGLHRLEVVTKLVAGGLLGAVALSLTRSVHCPPSLREIASDHYSIFVFGFAAGFIERTIPKMISVYSQNDSHSSIEKE